MVGTPFCDAARPVCRARLTCPIAQSQYDQSVNTYSPDGKLYQVDYAYKAIENSGYVRAPLTGLKRLAEDTGSGPVAALPSVCDAAMESSSALRSSLRASC